MPLVTVKLIEGVFSASQKEEMVRQLTEVMVAIESEPLRHVTLVVIDEVKSGDWGVGGKLFTTDAVKALAAGKSTPLRALYRSGAEAWDAFFALAI
jgi:4-oxalocrotonate tautomerase